MTLRRVVVATTNPGKLAEIRRLLAPLEYELIAQDELGIAPTEENAPTFVENALAKARAAARACGLPALADDSGIEVDALGGEPGVHSARYAGIRANDAVNVEKLLGALTPTPAHLRRARFRCVAVYLAHAQHPAPLVAEGIWEGEIAAEPRGSNGFGYDPVFYLPALGRTAAELDAREKDRLSHRALAFTALARRLAQTAC